MAHALASGLLKSEEKSVSRAIRVLHVIPATPDGGCAMIFAKRQIASLDKIGIKVKTFFLTSRTSPASLARERRKLKTEVQSFKPDLIHAHYGTMTAMLCATATTLPLVVTYRGSDLNLSARVGILRSMSGRLFSQLAALRATKIICVSEQLKNRLWWRKSRASVIPSGVDLHLFSPQAKDEARAQLGWSQAERIVLFNAGTSPRVKRLDLAQAGVESARKLCGRIRLVIVKGDVAPEEMPLYLSAADCLLFTSDREGSPNIVKEAMACNLPIVTVDVGDTVERLRGVEPTRIAKRDPQNLGAALADILNLNCRSNGRERVHEISGESIALKIRSVYEAVCDRRSASSIRTLVARPKRESVRQLEEGS